MLAAVQPPASVRGRSVLASRRPFDAMFVA